MKILLLILIVILGLIFIISCNNKEHIINTDETNKEYYKKCCEGKKCYGKPNFLNQNCNENKKQSRDILIKNYDQMFTTEEYRKILKDNNILNVNNKMSSATLIEEQRRVREERAKQLDRVQIKSNVDPDTFKNIVNDNRDIVKGYEVREFAEYIINIKNSSVKK
jgi:hypothetical protein